MAVCVCVAVKVWNLGIDCVMLLSPGLQPAVSLLTSLWVTSTPGAYPDLPVVAMWQTDVIQPVESEHWVVHSVSTILLLCVVTSLLSVNHCRASYKMQSSNTKIHSIIPHASVLEMYYMLTLDNIEDNLYLNLTIRSHNVVFQTVRVEAKGICRMN